MILSQRKIGKAFHARNFRFSYVIFLPRESFPCCAIFSSNTVPNRTLPRVAQSSGSEIAEFVAQWSLVDLLRFFPFSTETQLYWIKHGSKTFVGNQRPATQAS